MKDNQHTLERDMPEVSKNGINVEETQRYIGMLEKSAQAQEVVAEFALGILNIEGSFGLLHLPGAIDRVRGVGYLIQAAKQKYGKAIPALSKVLLQGGLSDQNMYEALLKLFQDASEEGDLLAALTLAKLYARGNGGISRNATEAISRFVPILKQPPEWEEWVPEARYLLGGLYLETGVVEQGVNLIRLSSDRGWPEAQFTLATIYLDGKHRKMDLREGIKLLWKAADNGFPEACLFLADIHSKGSYDVRQNAAVAKELFEKAANAGNAEASFRLGEINFQEGKVGIAIGWLEKAAERGRPEAQLFLGRIRFYGVEGKFINETLGVELFAKAAETGSEEAKALLVDLCFKNADREWYAQIWSGVLDIFALTHQYKNGLVYCWNLGSDIRDAALHKNEVKSYSIGALTNMGMYANHYLDDGCGKGIPLLVVAAEHGNDARLQWTLGKMYLEGLECKKFLRIGSQNKPERNVPQDIDRGLKLIHKASEGGNFSAKFFLAGILLRGELEKKDVPSSIKLFAEVGAVSEDEQVNRFEGGYCERVCDQECAERMEARRILGKLYYEGTIVKKDLNLAKEYCLSFYYSSSQEDPEIVYYISMILKKEGGEYSKWLKIAADLGNLGALDELLGHHGDL